MMKKIAATLFLILAASPSWATYTILRDAGTLNRGTLPNERLDCSYVTCSGSSNTIYGQTTFKNLVTVSSGIFLSSPILSGNLGITAKLFIAPQDETLQSAIALRQYNLGNFSYGFDIGIDDNVNGNLMIGGFNNGVSSGGLVQVSNRDPQKILGVNVTPLSPLHVKGGRGTVMRVEMDAPQASINASDVLIGFYSQAGLEASISGSGVSGVFAYNTFTGSHYTQIDDKDDMQMLYLVEGTGEALTSFPNKTVTRSLTEDERKRGYSGNGESDGKMVTESVKSEAAPKAQLTKSRLCSTRKSAAAWGFWIGTDGEGRDMIAAIGTGFAYVANKGEDIEIGDYLMSSDVAGHVEKQDDDIQHNYSVAKAREAIHWNHGEKFRKIAVTYHGG